MAKSIAPDDPLVLQSEGIYYYRIFRDYDKAFEQLSTGRGNVIRQVSMLKDVSNIKPKNEISNELVEGAMVD